MPITFPQNLIPFLMHQQVMNGISESALTELRPYFEVLIFEPGSQVFKENDLSNDLYIIFEGEVSLVKEDEQRSTRYTIGKLGVGEVFGEMSFIDDSPRSCSIEAIDNLILIKLAPKESREFSTYVQEIYEKIVRNIATIVIRRMRESNTKFAKIKEIEIRKLQVQNDFTNLVMDSTLGIIIVSGISGAIYLSTNMGNGFYWINWLAVLSLLLIGGVFLRRHKDGLQHFGLWVNNSFPVKLLSGMALLAIACGMALYLISYFRGVVPVKYMLPLPFLILYPLYAFLTEFILRGTVQSVLTKFYFSSSQWWPVIYTALLVSACNAYFGFTAAFIVFFLNILCGATYCFAKNIYVSTIVHIIVVLLFKFNGLLPFANMT